MDNATNRVLDRLAALDQAAGGTGTDYAVAKRLGVERQHVSKWRTGKDQMSDGMAIRAAELLGVEPLRLIGEIRMERARDEREKKFWQKTVKGAGGKVAGVVVAAVMMTAFGSWPAPAYSAQPAQSVVALDVLYNARNPRRRRPWWRWLLPFPMLEPAGAFA